MIKLMAVLSILAVGASMAVATETSAPAADTVLVRYSSSVTLSGSYAKVDEAGVPQQASESSQKKLIWVFPPADSSALQVTGRYVQKTPEAGQPQVAATDLWSLRIVDPRSKQGASDGAVEWALGVVDPRSRRTTLNVEPGKLSPNVDSSASEWSLNIIDPRGRYTQVGSIPLGLSQKLGGKSGLTLHFQLVPKDNKSEAKPK